MEIEIKEASKMIRQALILDEVNLSMSGGHIYGLQGPNGSGKTMLLRLIAGLIQPTSGSVLIDGLRLGNHKDFPDSMGLLIENSAFIPGYTGFRNLELLASIRGVVDAAQIRETLTQVGLDPDDKRKFRKYSLGMKQRLGIAAAIMEKPELLLLDEPTNALDEAGILQICNLLRRERERGALIILASHDASLLNSIADSVFTICAGKVKEREAG